MPIINAGGAINKVVKIILTGKVKIIVVLSKEERKIVCMIKEIIMRNITPIRRFDLACNFCDTRLPKPEEISIKLTTAAAA